MSLLAAVALLAFAAPESALSVSPPTAEAAQGRPRTIAELSLARTSRSAPVRTGLAAPPVVSYDITARLDERRHSVAAKASVRWTNASAQPVRELWLHLYLNAFANNRTLFMRSPRSSRRTATPLGEPGSITVHRLSARQFGGRDLWRGADQHSPGDPADATDIRVPLPEPVLAGASLTLDVEWTARLPTLVERTGHSGDFFAVAQWFPKIAYLQPDGVWSHFAFHPLSEFSADFGNYAVTLDIPSGFALAATGQETSAQSRGARRIVRSEARGVLDFAWVAWRGCDSTTIRVGGVRVDVLSPRGRQRELGQTLATLRQGLPFFETRYGTYPYPALHVVFPPDTAEGAGGMEYPTLITTGAPWYAPLVGMRWVQTITAHELAHQWFYGIIATDEHAWPFLDEGLASYAECELMERLYGAGSALDLPWVRVSCVAESRTVAVEYGRKAPIAQPAAAFDSMEQLGALAYWRTSILLRTLGNVYGSARLEQALGSYARAERGAHPGPADLAGAIRRHLGDGAAANLQEALFNRGTVDYSVERIGLVASPKADRVVTSRVVVHRKGALVFPVTIALTTSDGSRSLRQWDGVGTTYTVELTGPSPVVSAVVDPERNVLLDDNLLNNTAVTERRFAWRSLERGLSLAELVLLGLGP